jgi:alkanesulfonate monooxygenase SsuD/methylene tetrahydromethanopterin reductase-like flavin-dependent oxidoreductase (luciferase family)
LHFDAGAGRLDRVKLGFGLISCQRYPGDPRTDVDLYRQALELSEEAERLGFDSVWTSEHHFQDDAYMPSLLPVSAAIAARTSRVEIGTGLVLAPFYEAVRLAEDSATVDILSDGRFVLGLGLGWRDEELEAFRVPSARRVRLLEDCVTVCRQAWADGVTTGGEATSYPGVSVTPKPPRPGGPPIWIGAHVERAVRRAGRIADGFMAGSLAPASFGEQVRWILDELDRSGRDPATFEFAVYVPTFAWPEADAWERVRDHYAYMVWKYQDTEDAHGRTGPPAPAPPLTAAREQELRAGMVLGTPSEVASQVLRYREAAGVPVHYIAQLYWPGLDPGVQREALEVFGEEVAPLVRRAQP